MGEGEGATARPGAATAEEAGMAHLGEVTVGERGEEEEEVTMTEGASAAGVS